MYIYMLADLYYTWLTNRFINTTRQASDEGDGQYNLNVFIGRELLRCGEEPGIMEGMGGLC